MSRSTSKILVVDDDAALAENLAEIVESLGAAVDIVASAQKAVAQAAGGAYAVALVDLRLPDGSGLDVIAELRACSPSTEVILITGDATVDSAIAAVRDGAFAYVVKPFSSQDLLETTRRALAKVEGVRERERLRVELERSERRHRELIEAVPAFVMALDAEDKIALWNRRLEDVTGFSRGEMIGKPGARLFEGQPDATLPVKDGPNRLVRWERTEMEAGEREGWTYAVGIDVTDARDIELRARRAERLAAVGTLAAGLAHEIRNPLNSAQLQLTLLLRRLDRGDVTVEGIRPIAVTVQGEIERLGHLVNDFLSFAQPRPLALQKTDVNGLVRDVLTFIGPEAESAKVNVADELAAALPPIQVDPERLRQVVLNLARNAFEAMPEGGTLTLRTRILSRHVELDIEDTGVGFDDEQPIFDAFFTTKPHGTGLGLSIVHRIVADHGGTIKVRSRPGQTCFTLSLPIG